MKNRALCLFFVFVSILPSSILGSVGLKERISAAMPEWAKKIDPKVAAGVTAIALPALYALVKRDAIREAINQYWDREETYGDFMRDLKSAVTEITNNTYGWKMGTRIRRVGGINYGPVPGIDLVTPTTLGKWDNLANETNRSIASVADILKKYMDNYTESLQNIAGQFNNKQSSITGFTYWSEDNRARSEFIRLLVTEKGEFIKRIEHHSKDWRSLTGDFDNDMWHYFNELNYLLFSPDYWAKKALMLALPAIVATGLYHKPGILKSLVEKLPGTQR